MTPQHEKGAIPVRAPGLEIEEAGDGFIIYDEARDRIHYLNHTATLVLEACQGELDATGITDLVATLYSLPNAPLEDVDSVLLQLEQEGLIHWRSSDGQSA